MSSRSQYEALGVVNSILGREWIGGRLAYITSRVL